MKFEIASTTLILAFASSIQAAPAPYEEGTEMSKREYDNVKSAIALLNTYAKKREDIPSYELAERDYPIVTKVLELVKDTNTAPGVIEWFIKDPTLSKIATNTIVSLIKSGTINLNTLFKSLNDSGLLVSVIQDLISDCEFYAEIYSLALNYISNLAEEITQKINSKRDLYAEEDFMLGERSDLYSRATTSSSGDTSVTTELMESLKNSGLANQVVEQLITDPTFLKWGANLIQELFQSNAITLGQVVDAIEQSGLVQSLFKLFFNYDTLKTIITNALAAAFGKCNDGATTAPTSTTASVTPTTPSNCKKRKRSYY